MFSACTAIEVENARGDAALDNAAIVQGFSKNDILTCAGEPSKRFKTNVGEVWQYTYDAYKDPELNPEGDWDANYIGVTNITFLGQTVSSVTYAQIPETNSIGMGFSDRSAASLSLPVLRRC